MNDAKTDGTSGAELLAAEAMRVRHLLPDVQYGHTEGAIDLTWGHPDPSTFAGDDVAEATATVLGRHGWQALSYGAPAGAASVRTAIADHVSAVDAPVSPHEVLVTAGSSGGLDLVLSLLTRPGDVVLVERPTYFLALKIFADHGLRVIGMAGDHSGPDPDDLRHRATAARDAGANVFVYLVPVFANPTGRCMPLHRMESLLAAATSSGVTVIEDDVYRDTASGAPPSMWSLDRRVLRLGSFSKSLAPGLRVGYLTATAEVVERFAGCGLLDSGGAANHFAAMVVGELVASGRFGDVVHANHHRYRARRDALVQALDRSLFSFEVPQGGFFLWLGLPAGAASPVVVEAARDAGVLVSDGRLFFADRPDEGFVRASFSMLDDGLLREGALRLNAAVEDIRRGLPSGR